MNKRHRILASLVILLTLASLVLSACAKETEVAPTEAPTVPTAKAPEPATPEEVALPYEGVTLRCLSDSAWWSATYAKDIVPETGLSLIEEFRQKTGATVELDYLSYSQVYDKAALEFSSGSDAYDCFIFAAGWVGGFANAGFLEPIPDEVLARVDFEDFQGSELIADPNGKVYWLPYFNGTPVEFIRTDLFGDPKEQAAFREKYGYPLAAPKTFPQIVDIAEFFNRPPDLYGASYSFKSYADMPYMIFAPRMNQWGIDPVGPNLEPQFNNEKGLRALENMIQIRKYTNPESCTWAAEGNVAFLEGKAAIYERWTTLNYFLSNPKTSKILGKFEVVPMPTWEDGEPVAHALWLPWGWAVSSFSRNKEAAIAWAEFVTGKDAQKKAAFFGNTPARLSTLADPEVQKAQPYLVAQYDIAKNGVWHNMPTVPEALQITHDIVGENLQQAICGLKSPQQALQDAEDQLNKLRTKLGYK